MRVDEVLEREKSRALGHALRAAINTPIQVCGVVCVCVMCGEVAWSCVWGGVMCDVTCVHTYEHSLIYIYHVLTRLTGQCSRHCDDGDDKAMEITSAEGPRMDPAAAGDCHLS